MVLAGGGGACTPPRPPPAPPPGRPRLYPIVRQLKDTRLPKHPFHLRMRQQ